MQSELVANNLNLPPLIITWTVNDEVGGTKKEKNLRDGLHLTACLLAEGRGQQASSEVKPIPQILLLFLCLRYATLCNIN
jgi:hypothetical protein